MLKRTIATVLSLILLIGTISTQVFVQAENPPLAVSMSNYMVPVTDPNRESLYVVFNQNVRYGEPDTSSFITFVQEDYLDYIYINGVSARNINKTNPSAIVIHYNVVSFVFTIYVQNGHYGLDRTKSNEIILSKDFPILGSEKLGINYKYVNQPMADAQAVETIWTETQIPGTLPVDVIMPDIMAPVTAPNRETIYFFFDKKIRQIEAGDNVAAGYLILCTQDRYLDYIFINGVSARNIDKSNPGSAIQIHYDINSNAFTVYIMSNWLDRTKSNEIVFTKDFPLLGTEKLGKSYKFATQPMADASTVSTVWTRSEFVGKLPIEVTMPGVMAPVTAPDRETVYIDFDRKIRQLEAGESLVAGYLIILTQDRYLDYIFINGVNGRTMEKANPGAIQMHYDVVSDVFTIYIMKNITGGMNRTNSNEIILSKDFPLLGTETLGTAYKFTTPPMADESTTSTTWTKTQYTENLPLEVTMPGVMAPVTTPDRETVYIDFDRKIRQLEAGESLVAGYLIILTQDRYLDCIYINGMNGRTMENANPGAIQMHYDVVSDVFTIYIMRNIASGMDRTKNNEIILTKDFPLLGTEKLGTSFKFTTQPMADASTTSTTWTKSGLSPITVRNYKVSNDGLKNITNITQGLTVANFIKGGVIAGDNKTTFEFIAAGETTTLSQNSTIGTGTTVSVLVNNVVVDTYKIKLYGDVTGNGAINLEDLIAVRDHLLETIPIQDKFKSAGDLYAEGNITLNDLVGMMAFVSENGLINQNL